MLLHNKKQAHEPDEEETTEFYTHPSAIANPIYRSDTMASGKLAALSTLAAISNSRTNATGASAAAVKPIESKPRRKSPPQHIYDQPIVSPKDGYVQMSALRGNATPAKHYEDLSGLPVNPKPRKSAKKLKPARAIEGHIDDLLEQSEEESVLGSEPNTKRQHIGGVWDQDSTSDTDDATKPVYAHVHLARSVRSRPIDVVS